MFRLVPNPRSESSGDRLVADAEVRRDRSVAHFQRPEPKSFIHDPPIDRSQSLEKGGLERHFPCRSNRLRTCPPFQMRRTRLRTVWRRWDVEQRQDLQLRHRSVVGPPVLPRDRFQQDLPEERSQEQRGTLRTSLRDFLEDPRATGRSGSFSRFNLVISERANIAKALHERLGTRPRCRGFPAVGPG